MLEITSKNFKTEIETSDKPILVDFWAPWCGPCRMIAPVLEEFSSENENKLKVGKVNVDNEMALAEKFNINSIPCLILFKQGTIVKTLVGYQDKNQLNKLLELI